MTLKSVPPMALEAALDHVRAGGELLVPTYGHCTVIDRRALQRFEGAGEWLLKEEGEGYRMRSGRKSAYLLPGQLKYG